MNFSAAQLVKCSASQLLYFLVTQKTAPVTKRQLKGNKYSEKVVRQLKAAEERRGTYKLGKHKLFFCVDAVKEDTYIEIKMVDDKRDTPTWYLESSLLQSCLYATLLGEVKTLDTPAFKLKEGYPQVKSKVIKNRRFVLYFGDAHYQVESSKKVMKHYLEKAKVVIRGYKSGSFDECRAFDSKFKHKEYSKFNIKHVKV
jgi:hypothetical protein